MSSVYRNDLAYIQHHGFSDFARSASPGLLNIFRRAGITTGHVVDLGCGDGTWLRMLTQNGFAATGIDQSSSLVHYARKHAPKALVKVRSVHQAAFDSCDAITALGEVLSYRSGRTRSVELSRIFQRAHSALRPGGLFVFDLLVTGRRMEYEAWRTGPAWAVLVRVREEPGRLVRQIVTFRKTGRSYRRDREEHVLSVSSTRVILAELRRVGFVARTSPAYGKFRLPPRRIAFIARKR
jgi:SAM-dependent methyltransferase